MRRVLELTGVMAVVLAVTVLLNMTLVPVPIAGQEEAAPAAPTLLGRAGSAGHLDDRL